MPTITPAILDSITLSSTEGRDQYLRGDRWYALSLGAHFYTIDKSNPKSLAVLNDLSSSTYLNGAHGLDVDEPRDTAWVAVKNTNRVTPVDIATDTASVIAAGSLQDNTNLNAPTHLLLLSDGNRAVVACNGGAALAIIDISQPAVATTVLGTLVDAAHLTGVHRMARVGDRIYCGGLGAGAGAGLAHVDCSADTPVLTGFCANATGAFAVDVVGDYAFTVTSGVAATLLDVYEIADPSTHAVHANPIHVASLANASSNRPLGVTVTRGVAVIPCQDDTGLIQFADVTDPLNPTHLTALTQPVPGDASSNGSGELYHNYVVKVDANGIGYTTAHNTPAHATSIDVGFPRLPKLIKLNGVPVLLP